jgi:hypothetical protein
MRIFKAQIGGTLYLYGHEDKDYIVDTILKRAKRTGEMAEFPHAKVYFERVPIVDLSQSGSSQYIWAKDGNRVKCEIVKRTITKDNQTNEIVGTCYADLD